MVSNLIKMSLYNEHEMSVHTSNRYFANMERLFRATVFLAVFVTVCLQNGIVCEAENRSGIEAIVPDCVFGVQNLDYFIYNSYHRDGVIVSQNTTTIPVKDNVTTIFLIHGFTSEANNSQYRNLTATLVDKYDVNVLSVDWKKGSCAVGGVSLTQLLAYPDAVHNTRVVGEDLAKFISRLISDYNIRLQDLVVVGHSLGAQVAGFCGKHLQQMGVGTLPQILALDPAGPGFETNSCENRICETDAEFLQVFHTSFAFGMHKVVGDVDFYFNGGSNQPGCPLLNRPSCSHSSAIGYLIYILRHPNCKFIGRKWDRSVFSPPSQSCTEEDCSVPGPLASLLPARGSFYVDTDDLPRFCLQHFQ